MRSAVGARREHDFDLGHRSGVEARAEPGQERQHLRRRIGLHGVEHARVGQRLGEGLIVVAHDVEIDDEARTVVVARRLRRKSRMRAVMGALLTRFNGPRGTALKFGRTRFARRQRVRDGACRAMETRAKATGSRPEMLPWLGAGDPFRTAGKMDKPLRCRPLEGRRDQRSPLRRCFKPRPPLSAGCAGFASGCRLSGSELSRPRTVSAFAPGGCPASCPDAHQPTRGHRHVRNWAIAN